MPEPENPFGIKDLVRNHWFPEPTPDEVPPWHDFTNWYNRPAYEKAFERRIVMGFEGGPGKEYLLHETADYLFYRRPLIEEEELDNQMTIWEVVVVPQRWTREVQAGGHLSTVVLSPGIDINDLSFNYDHLQDVYNGKFLMGGGSEDKKNYFRGVRFWVTDFAGSLKPWEECRFDHYQDVAYLQALMKADIKMGELAGSLGIEIDQDLRHSFSAITKWQALMAAMKQVVETRVKWQSVVKSEIQAEERKRCEESLRFLGVQKQLGEIRLLSPTLLVHQARGQILPRSIHDVSRLRTAGNVVLAAAHRQEFLDFLGTQLSLRSGTREEGREEWQRITQQFTGRVQTLAQITEIFEEEFRSWYLKMKKQSQLQGVVLDKVISQVQEDYLPRKIEVWLGGKDKVLKAEKVRSFLESRKVKNRYFGPLVEVFQVIYLPQASHNFHLASRVFLTTWHKPK